MSEFEKVVKKARKSPLNFRLRLGYVMFDSWRDISIVMLFTLNVINLISCHSKSLSTQYRPLFWPSIQHYVTPAVQQYR